MQCGLDKLLRQRRFWMGEHFADRILLNQFSVTDNCDTIANALNHIHLMSNKKNGQAKATVNIFQQFQNRTGRCRIEGAGGLVAQQDFGIAG